MRKTKTDAKPEEYQGTPATVWLREKVVGKSFGWFAAGAHLYDGVIKDVLGYQTLLLSCFDHREGRAYEFIQPLESISWDPSTETGFRFNATEVGEHGKDHLSPFAELIRDCALGEEEIK